MKYQPVPPQEVMEGECYYITHLGISDKFYTIVAGPTSAESLLLLSLRGLVHRTKEEAVAFADGLLAPGIEEIQIMPEMVEDPEPDCSRCSHCNGTGEGQYEDQICTACRGKGVLHK